MSNYRIGQTYYKLIDQYDLGCTPSQPGRWRIVNYKVMGETKDKVIIEVLGGRHLEIKKPWEVHVSPWDAVDDKLAEIQKSEQDARDEAYRQERAARERFLRIDMDKTELLNFRNHLTI